MVFLSSSRKITDDYYSTPQKLVDIFKRVLIKYKMENCLYIDPSMGDGRLLRTFPSDNIIGIDINKKHIKNKSDARYINGDFLKYHPDQNQTRIVVAGNPPFSSPGGKNLCILFLNHALTFAKRVILIMPLSMRKWSVLKGVKKNCRLICDVSVPKECHMFEDMNGKIKKVKVCIQVWDSNDTRKNKWPVIDNKSSDFKLFITNKSNSMTPDFFIRRVGTNSNVGMILESSNNFGDKPSCDFGVKCTRKNKNIVMKILTKLHKDKTFEDIVKDRFSTSFPSITKSDIYHIYNNRSYPRYEDHVRCLDFH